MNRSAQKLNLIFEENTKKSNLKLIEVVEFDLPLQNPSSSSFQMITSFSCSANIWKVFFQAALYWPLQISSFVCSHGTTWSGLSSLLPV